MAASPSPSPAGVYSMPLPQSFRPVAALPAVVRSPVGGVLTTLMGLYVFLYVVPWAELMVTLSGINLRILAITAILVTIGVVFSGQAARFWSVSISKVWVILLGVFFVSSFTGFYPRGSLTYMLPYTLRFHTFPFLICAVAQTGQQVRRLIYWGACGGLAVLLATAVYGRSLEGRLSIPNTSLGNPNDLALTLLLGGVFVLAMLYSTSLAVRMVPIVTLPLILYYILQTGSRANFLTIVVLAICLFLSTPWKVKVRLFTVAPLLIGLMIALLPSSTLQRLTLIVTNPEEVIGQSGYQAEHAIASQMARVQLQENAISLTLRHPILGVGPWEFADAVEDMVREETGNKSGWQNAHNVYLQIAAENGIPGFLLFIGIMFWALKTNYQVYKLSLKHPAGKAYEGQSLCLLLLMIGYSFGISFGNYIYDPSFPILIGLTAANLMAIKQDLAAAAPPPPRLNPFQMGGS